MKNKFNKKLNSFAPKTISGWFGESTRHMLAAKGVKTGRKYHYDLPLGTTDVKQEMSDGVIKHTYDTELKSASAQDKIDKLRSFLEKNFKIDSYGQSYLAELETSYNMYGDDGVKTQVAYIMSNAKATTEEGKKFRKNISENTKKFLSAKGKLGFKSTSAEGRAREFFVTNFKKDPEHPAEKAYFAEWVERFERGNPENMMDLESKQRYLDLLAGKIKVAPEKEWKGKGGSKVRIVPVSEGYYRFVKDY